MNGGMKDLHDTIPDPDAVLALEPEELGATILFLLRARGGSFHPHNCMMEILNGGDPSRGTSNYPQSRRQEIAIAVSEAFAWLGAQGLITPKPGDTGGWMILSRRARRFESEEDVRQFRMARSLNRDLLHPAIAEKVWLGFIRGDFAEAVFTAMRTVEIAVREAAEFPEGDHGVPMIRRAFHKDTGPLRDPWQEEAEREALMHLFAGAVGSYKNPHSHRNVPMEDADEATEIVMLASHLLRIVDARRSAQQERQTDEA